LRKVVYALVENWYNKGQIVLRTGEYCSQTFFVKKGKVRVMVRDKEVTEWLCQGLQIPEGRKEFYHFATLTKGSYFNLVNSFLDRPSLFSFVIGENNTQLLLLEQEEFDNLTKTSENLLMVNEMIDAKYGKVNDKYDFGRMVFHNIKELINAQKMKA
jgi:CRP-like cAMP-binding protein